MATQEHTAKLAVGGLKVWPGPTIRTRLIALVLVAIVPLLIFAGAALYRVAAAERDAVLDRIQHAARSMTLILDQRLAAGRALLDGLATSHALKSGDLAAFYFQAREAAEGTGAWIIVYDNTGAQVLNTLQPFGATLPDQSFAPMFAPMLEQPMVSDLAVGTVAQIHRAAISIPVRLEGETRYVLAIAYRAEEFSRLIAEQRMPREWISSILDSQGVTVARSLDIERFVGRRAAPPIRAAIGRGKEGHAVFETLEGIRVHASFARSSVSGWTAVIGVPVRVMEAPLRRSLWLLAGGGLALLALAVPLAIFSARRIAAPVQSLIPAALALGRGAEPPKPIQGVREVADVGAALEAAAARLRAHAEQRAKAEAALRHALERSTDILESISDAFFALDEEFRFAYANRRALEMWGRPRGEVIGRRLLEVFPQVEGSEVHAAYVQARAERKTIHVESISPVIKRWLSVTIYPAAGGGLSVYFQDVDERKRAEQRQALLAAEVDHRAKNMLALVQVMLRQTRAETIKEYAAAAQGRIAALARAHALLAQSRWEGADLGRLIDDELSPYRRGEAPRVHASGPPVSLGPRLAQSVAMVLHELATNAAKYGALSARQGHVDVGWSRQGGQLTLEWAESGGPAVQPPQRRGFGTGLIERTIREQHGGEVRFDWRDQGLVCFITLPLGETARAQPAA